MPENDYAPGSQEARLEEHVGPSEQKLKDQEDTPEGDFFTGNPPGPATGTQFEDPSKGSTWNVPIPNVPAHRRPDDLDPRVNGPFLDELHQEREIAYREVRNRNAGN